MIAFTCYMALGGLHQCPWWAVPLPSVGCAITLGGLYRCSRWAVPLSSVGWTAVDVEVCVCAFSWCILLGGLYCCSYS